MKILIDCGAHKGEAVIALRNKHGPFDRIFAFEANPRLCSKILKRQISDLILIDKAVWIEDLDSIPFYKGQKSISSSLIKTKSNICLEDPYDIAAIDFSKWLEKHTSPKDEVIVKMDIEGAEYPVIEQLIATRMIERIDVLYCEWHAGRRLPPKKESRARHAALLRALMREKLIVGYWA